MEALSLYRALGTITWFAALPLMRIGGIVTQKRYLFQGRLGEVPAKIAQNGPWDIWIHAVSVGEAGVARAIVDELHKIRPDTKILISSTTPAGYDHARKLMGDRCGTMICPLDFPQAVHRAANAVGPRIYACIETELWPSMIEEMHKRGAGLVLLNGRISGRSYPRYKKIRGITGTLLSKFSIICASSPASAARLRALGAPSDKIITTGNAKYQALINRPDRGRAAAISQHLGIPSGTPVVVAGSIRGGDEEHLSRAWQILEREFPELVLVIAPRHLENVPKLKKFFQEQGFSSCLWSSISEGDKASERIIIVDEIGRLFDIYGISHAAFVGGSMTPKGGQNLLEPAAWNIPVFYGPHTENFEDAALALEKAGAAGVVHSGHELAARIGEILRNRELAIAHGAACRKALLEVSADAATRQAEILASLLANHDSDCHK